MKKSYLFTILLFFLYLSSSWAQDARGTDFWVTFGNNAGYAPANVRLNLQIRIISGNRATTGTIHFTHLGTDTTFSIGAHEIFTYTLSAPEKAAAYNTTTDIINYNSVHITSVDSIAVYALNVHIGNNDQNPGFYGDVTNILPATTLGTEYYQVSYNNPNFFWEPYTHNAYAVVATQNNTNLFHNGSSV